MKSIVRILREHWQGAIVGALVGVLFWIPQECISGCRETQSRRTHWSKSVIAEVGSNKRHGVMPLFISPDGRPSGYLRYLDNRSLSEFLSQYSSLGIGDPALEDSVRSLLQLTVVINQIVDQRNMIQTTNSGGFVLGGVVPNLDVATNSLVEQYKNRSEYTIKRLSKYK